MIKMAERYCATTRNKILYPLTTENMLKNLRRICFCFRDNISLLFPSNVFKKTINQIHKSNQKQYEEKLPNE